MTEKLKISRGQSVRYCTVAGEGPPGLVLSWGLSLASEGKNTGDCSIFLAVQETVHPKSTATLPSFGPIEGRKWFFQICSQWKSQKNRFVLICFGTIQFFPPCIWDLLCMSYRLCTACKGWWIQLVSFYEDSRLWQSITVSTSNRFSAGPLSQNQSPRRYSSIVYFSLATSN